MVKIIAFIVFAFIVTNVVHADGCSDFLFHIQADQRNIDSLSYELNLQALDINSYNPSQQETPEYIERVTSYSVLSENYNAIVANHNNMVRIYKAECE